MKIALIVAMTEARVIGADGGLPWHLSTDLKHFKTLTMGKPIIMGGKTHRSIGKALPGRDNIVITRHPDNLSDDVTGTGSFDEALAQAQALAEARGVDEIMVIGGGEIYAQALPHADRLYVTEVHETVNGDTYFPRIDHNVWREVSRNTHQAGPRDSSDFSFVVLERAAGAV